MADEMTPDPAPVLAPEPQAAAAPVEAPEVAPDPTATAPSTSSAPSDPANGEPDPTSPESGASPDSGDQETPPTPDPETETKALPAATPITMVSTTHRRSDEDALFGSWVDVVAGEYSGRFGSFVATVSHDTVTGYPNVVVIRTRDADNLLIEVNYADVRPSDRNGGR